MCFSATVSFATGTLLSLIGLLSLRACRTRKELPLALVPVFFAIQQFSEGVVWKGFDWALDRHIYFVTHQVSVYIFLFFALTVWPVWIPFSIWCLEKSTSRKNILLSILIIGILVSMYQLGLLIYYGATASIVSGHINYGLTRPQAFEMAGMLLYLMAVAIPFLITSVRYMYTFGLLVFLSVIINQFLFERAVFGSVWCFFAALLSFFVYFMLVKGRKPHKKTKN
jgi:hypothetical protein